MIINQNANRLAIYFFYDRDGIVDDYIPYMLDDLKKNVSEICVVCNGKLDDAGRKKFETYTDNIIVRDNVGFDVWAYKEALNSYGWKKLESYDEVVLMNFTMMGPVYPLADMFQTMASKDLDFWGITQFYKTDDNPFPTLKMDYIPDHIQSHFIAVRNSLLSQKDFREYWDKMPMITGYLDSVSRHEARFTKHFEDIGYKWEVYVDASDYKELSHQPAVAMAKEMVAVKKCPIFKRRSFMQDYNVVLNESCGQEAVELYNYLCEHTDYDMKLFWDNLLRVENIADLKKNLHWNYILSSESAEDKVPSDVRIAIAMHIYFKDLIAECRDYASAMPDGTDFYITTDTEEKKDLICKEFSKICTGKLDVRVVPNCGRDVGPFLVEFREFISDYDYVCHVHDKKAGQARPGTIGTAFAYKCFENVLKSKEYVANIINTFEKNERLGLLAPPPPNHADYFITFGLEWGANFDNTVKLAKDLGIASPMNAKKEPIAPLGSYYWARTDAIKKVFEKEWKYEDFPKEPVADDGTILHAIERIYPFAAQSEGYYSGWVMCDKGAAIELTNLNHMIREINDIIFFKGQDAGSYQETRVNLSSSYDYANEMKRKYGSALHSDAKLYYSDGTKEFNEDDTIVVRPQDKNGIFEYEFTLNNGNAFRKFRFDPCEYGNTILSQIAIKVMDEKGNVCQCGISDISHNGIKFKDKIVYINDDPWIMFDVKKNMNCKNVTISLKLDKNIQADLIEEIQDRVNHKLITKKLRSFVSKWLKRD